MKRRLEPDFAVRERKLVATQKPLLPVHSGEARYQAALDSDSRYRDLILSGFALALFATSGLGEASQSAGPVRASFLCLAAAGLALRATAARNANGASNPRLVLLVIAGFAGIGCVLGGAQGMLAIGIAVAVAGIGMLCVAAEPIKTLLIGLGGAALIGNTVWSLTNGDLASHPLGVVAGVLLGVTFGARSLVAAGSLSADLRPTLILTSFAAYAWIVPSMQTLLPWNWAVPAALGACALFAVAERAVTVRSSFAPVIAAMMIIQLAGFVDSAPNQPKLIPIHLAIMLVQFGLLGMAGYRYTFAALSRLPIATYRSTPQCLVPSSDHAWDHPLRIDAV